MTSRSVAFALLAAGVAALASCASGKTRRPSVSTEISGQPCSSGPSANWSEVLSDGFKFCVPSNWKLDERFESRHKRLYPSLFRLMSYTSPDTLQRVVFEVPSNGATRTELVRTVERCTLDNPTAQTLSVNGAPACRWAQTSWTQNAPQAINTYIGDSKMNPTIPQDFTRPISSIAYSVPNIRGRSIGGGVTWSVLQSVRSLP